MSINPSVGPSVGPSGVMCNSRKSRPVDKGKTPYSRKIRPHDEIIGGISTTIYTADNQ